MFVFFRKYQSELEKGEETLTVLENIVAYGNWANAGWVITIIMLLKLTQWAQFLHHYVNIIAGTISDDAVV